MADRQRLIGVCIAQAHSFLNMGFLSELDRATEKEGYGVAVFNSSLDFYWHLKDNNAPRAVYRAIRYEIFDAILVIYHSLHEEDLVREIVSGAQEKGVPVIIAGAELPGCWSILNDYEHSFKDLIRHIIRDHGVRDPFFIAGMKGESNSEDRLRCFREILAEFGIPFSDDRVDYGKYSAQPAAKIVRELIRKREKLPDAIVCANDVMAIAVCDELRANGIRVPEDVIVTGFDGIPAAFMIRPHLTTCSDDPATLAAQIMKLIGSLRKNDDPPRTIIHSFKPVHAGTCGCPDIDDDRYDALTVYRRSEVLATHENDLYHLVERMLMQKTPEGFLGKVAASLLPGSAIYLNKRILDINSGVDYSAESLEENLIMIPYREPEEELVIRDCLLSKLHPPQGQETGTTLFTSIYSDSVVCGFFSAHTTDLERDAQLIKRLSDVLNLVFTIRLGNARQRLLTAHLNDTLYQDTLTGLNNLKGLSRWFDAYASEELHHNYPLALSVYNIPRYTFIYENYGIDETESLVTLVAESLTAANPSALIIARTGEDQFVIVDSGINHDAISRIINQTTTNFFRRIESVNSAGTKPFFVEINCGCTTLDAGWKDATLENLIRLALGELYLTRMRSISHDVSKPSASIAELYSGFSLLMEKNLLKFHFQPIVDARTGQIYAYEALMRTDNLINMTPLDILTTAREYNRLYDVEKATLFGIIDIYVRKYSDFNGCKVFINTIPGHFLTPQDCAALRAQYESYLDCFVFELTEQDTTSEEELQRLKSLCKAGGKAQIAIDDYGTGHSNIVNLLRYAPEIIKIDRALISGIQNDSNKQLFVRNTIDFAHRNGIKALAEGVETSAELRAVIEYGVDLIQGFYTGRPAEQPLAAINESVRNEILEQKLLMTRFDRSAQVYNAADGETVDLLNLALKGYTCVQIPAGKVTLTGQEKQCMDMVILIAGDGKAELTLQNVNLKGVNETTVQLGERCELTLKLKGHNTLNKEGILVPPSSRLVLQGDGDLTVINNRNYSVGIGANYNDPYGTIVIDLEGRLDIRSSGDKVVCLGGGRSTGEGIILKRGRCRMSANGISVIGIGSSSGDSEISILGGSVEGSFDGNDTVGIGSVAGLVRLRSAGELNLVLNCERGTGIGTMSGNGDVLLEGGSTRVTVRCDAGTCIGTFSGELVSRISGGIVRVHGEGNRVAGFGTPDGACDTRIEGGDVQGDILASERMLMGNDQSRVVITGGNVRMFPDDGQYPVSPGGLRLYYQEPKDTDHYEQTFRDRRSSWVYKADRNPEGYLCIWIPREA